MLQQYEREITYAFRILSALSDGALHKGADIYANNACPESWGYKIAKKLEIAGYIKIKRGRYGGYILVTPLEEITLKDLVIAIEPSAAFIPFLKKTCPTHPDKSQCPAYKELAKMEEEMWAIFEKRSLEDIRCLEDLH